jgi:hypothetical protein
MPVGGQIRPFALVKPHASFTLTSRHSPRQLRRAASSEDERITLTPKQEQAMREVISSGGLLQVFSHYAHYGYNPLAIIIGLAGHPFGAAGEWIAGAAGRGLARHFDARRTVRHTKQTRLTQGLGHPLARRERSATIAARHRQRATHAMAARRRLKETQTPPTAPE